jgi:hypothetical protein
MHAIIELILLRYLEFIGEFMPTTNELWTIMIPLVQLMHKWPLIITPSSMNLHKISRCQEIEGWVKSGNLEI